MRRLRVRDISRLILLSFLSLLFLFDFIKKYWYIFLALVIITVAVTILVSRHEMKKKFFDLESALASTVKANYIMSGVDFEKSIANLLKIHGFRGIKLTPYSGDYGVDIIAKYNDVKYAFQCKWYSYDVGIKPVQEIYAGKAYYGADIAVVVTNVYLSNNAHELAEKTDVQIWDRKYLTKLVNSARKIII